jgi:cysteine-S-conjugate beta-lyase
MSVDDFNFDQIIERRGSGSLKWQLYDPDVLPLWVADMDFASPAPVLQALHARVDHGLFGYEMPSAALTETICARLDRMYGWAVTPDEIVYIPSLVTGINVACRAVCRPGEGMLVQAPVYPPFLTAPANHGLQLQTAELTPVVEGATLRYEIDYAAFEAAITPETRLFMLCHPHNPTGVEYTREQLTRLAEICLRHKLVICSDEIHCDLLLGGTRHTPLGSLSPEVAAASITMMAPSKTFNVPGLSCSFAIIPDAALRERVNLACAGIVPHVNALGLAAALAAYREGDAWLAALLRYLTANRDVLVDFVRTRLPGLHTTVPQATYLAWLDCRGVVPGSPHAFFLEKARVALNEGAHFGPGGEGFVRLNFGCPRSRLLLALEKMESALKSG